jgi:hypothetical protein
MTMHRDHSLDLGLDGLGSKHHPPIGRNALRSGKGRIRTGGIERDVAFERPGLEVADDVTAAYHVKYDGYGAGMVGTVVSAEAVRSMLTLEPR